MEVSTSCGRCGRVGVVTWYLGQLGYDWNHVLNEGEAMGLVVVASAWGRISYNFLFFLAGLQAIPRSVIAAPVPLIRCSRR